MPILEVDTWKAKCPIFKAIVAGFRGKVALKEIGRLGVPGICILKAVQTWNARRCAILQVYQQQLEDQEVGAFPDA